MGLEDWLSKKIKEEAEEKIQKFEELGDIFRERKEELGEIIEDGIKDIVIPSIKKLGIKKFRKKTSDFIRTVSDSELKRGDVIGVHRGIYDHYGIYIGNSEVIHYSNEESDFGVDFSYISIHQAPLSRFKDGADNVFVVDFEAYRDYVENSEADDFEGLGKLLSLNPIPGGGLGKLPSLNPIPGEGPGKLLSFGNEKDKENAFDILFGNEKITLYSPEKTVERAESRLGERDYNIATNNCEHFATWCKTGKSKSSQVEKFLEGIGSVIVSPKS